MNKLYGVAPSPYTRKVQIAFAHRGIPYEMVSTMPGSDEPSFAAASPLRKIPAIETAQGHRFADSSVILAYFEKAHADKPLYPSDPGLLAQALFMEEYADTKLSEATAALYFQTVLAPTVFGRESDVARVAELKGELIPKQLALLETMLPQAGWIVGGEFSVADVSVGAALLNLGQAGYAVDPAKYPRTAGFVARFIALPVVSGQLAMEKQTLDHIAASRAN